MSKSKRDLLDLLHSWDKFIKELKNCDQKECERMVELEIANKNRHSFVDRIAGRISKLERDTRKSEIMERALEVRLQNNN